MKRMKNNGRAHRIMAGLCALVLLAACTQDELFSAAGDANGGEALPEGMYPLQIGGVSVSAIGSGQPWGAERPQTRVSENSDGTGSEFEVNDAITVSLDGNAATYTYDGSAWTSNDPLYWQSTQPAAVIAWYPANETIGLDDQRNGLAYVLQATKEDVSYNQAVSLDFSNQLAKVRVELSGLRAGKVTSVSLNGCRIKCTNSQGSVSAGSETGDIQMHKVERQTVFEANVLPGESISTFTLNESIECNLTSAIATEAGKMHIVSLQVNAEGVPENVTVITKENCNDINGDGNYVVSGTFNSTITVTGGSPHIYLDEAEVSVTSGSAINITGGSPTIHVVGENNSVMSSNGAGIYVASGGTVTITGNGRGDVLTAKGGNGGSGIGGYTSGTNRGVDCGNIEISNVTVYSYGSTNGNNGDKSAGIGGTSGSSCGTITIDNATVHAYGTASANYYAPGIGCGYPCAGAPHSIPKVTISNQSEIHAHRGGGGNTDYIGWAGDKHNYTSGNSTINLGGGTCTSSTVYCYTGSGDTVDKTVVYDASGTGTEQSQ